MKCAYVSCVIATKAVSGMLCARRVKHVVDLDLTVTHTGPHDDGARGTGGRRARPRKNHDKISFLWRGVASKH